MSENSAERPAKKEDTVSSAAASKADTAPASKRELNPLLVDDTGLIGLRARPSLVTYFRQLWGRRHFISAEARSKALSSGRGTFLGHAWILINPLLQVAVFVVIFGMVLKVDRGLDNFIGFLVIGVIVFGFITGGLSAGSGLVQSSRNMITSFHFPRAALGVSVILRDFIDNLAPMFMAVLIAVLTQLGQPIHWTIIFVVPLYLLIHVFGLGLTLVAARLTAFIPDTKSLISLLQRALFFLSGVFFPLSRFDAHPTLKTVMEANPVYQFLTAVRLCVLDGEIPSISTWIYLSAWSFGLCIFGLIFFWQAEARYSGVH